MSGPNMAGANGAGGQAASGVTNNFTVVNPVAEPTSETARKASAYIGGCRVGLTASGIASGGGVACGRSTGSKCSTIATG